MGKNLIHWTLLQLDGQPQPLTTLKASYHIRVESNVAVETFVGPVTCEDVWSVTEALMSDPAYHRNINGIIDFSQARMQFGFMEVERFCRQLVMNGNYSRGRWAILPGDQLGYGLSRIYQSMASDLHAGVEIFFSMAEAERWVQADESAVSPKVPIKVSLAPDRRAKP